MAQLRFLLILGSLFITCGQATPIHGGVLEGKIVTLNNYRREVNSLKTPYMVYVDVVDLNDPRDDAHLMHTKCGGVIIGARSVLTAAHCIVVAQRPYITIVAGAQNLQDIVKNKAQVTTADTYVTHANYIGDCKIAEEKYLLCTNDIALIRTKDAFNFRPSIKPAVLAGSRSKQTTVTGWIYGWGMTAASLWTDRLRKAQMKVAPLKTCKNAYKSVVLSDSYWCLVSDKGKAAAACPGDSGGPFVVNDIVYGLFAFSNVLMDHNDFIVGCDNTQPSVYLNIIKYENWIKENVKKLAPQDFKTHLKFDNGSKSSVRPKQK